MTIVDKKSAEQLKSFVERIENAEAQKGQAASMIKEVYAIAKVVGFDEKALRQIMKRRKADMRKSTQMRATVDLYMSAIASFEGTELGQWAKDWATEQRQVEQQAEPRHSSYAEATGRGPRSDLN